MCLQPCLGESVPHPAKMSLPIGFTGIDLATLSRQCQPRSNHPTHSSCYIAPLPKEASEDICSSRPQRENAMTICPTHLIHLALPCLITLVCVAISCKVGWHDLGTHGALRCFSLWTCNPENQTLSPGTIMPLGDPAQVTS